MKKAKILLTAIAVFALVGAALAFKAKRTITIYTTTTSTTLGWPVRATATFTSNDVGKVYWTSSPVLPAVNYSYTISHS